MIYEIIICYDCDDENNELNIVKLPLHEILEKDVSIIKCKHGHETLIISDSQKFENLLYFAFSSFQSHFYHQTISNMTSAYENLQELIIKMILKTNNIQDSEIEDSLKIMKLSERRLGGFYYLFQNTFNKKPKLPNSNKEVAFRNKVIHNGYICTKKETLNYMIEMYKIIMQTINEIEDYGMNIREYIINNTPLKNKEIQNLKEVYIWNIDLHEYVGTRVRKEKINQEYLIDLLNKMPDLNKLVIGQAFNENNIG